jgi:hypothetical protein
MELNVKMIQNSNKYLNITSENKIKNKILSEDNFINLSFIYIYHLIIIIQLKKMPNKYSRF